MRKFLAYINLLLLLFSIHIFGCSDNSNETFKTTEIKSDHLSDVIFIKTMNWGLTGDNQITVISLNDEIDFNKKESDDYYIFKGLDPFLYRHSGDSLIIYSYAKAKIPKNFKTQWKIVQTVVDNPTFMDLHRDTGYKSP